MTVAHVLKGKGRTVTTLAPHRTVAEAARLLSERRIGAVVVTGADGAIVGILSERDIVQALAEHGADCLSHAVSRHMTSEVVTAVETDTIVEIMERMTDGKFRHVPVVDGAGLCGIVSIGDVVKHRLAEMEAEARALRDYIAT